VARYFFDSNIFLYAMGSEHPEKAPCRKLLELVAKREMEAVTSSEVLQEVLYVRLRRGDRIHAIDSVRSIHELMGGTLPVTSADILDACEILGQHPGLDTRDAVHAAVAKRNAIAMIVSIDKGFDGLKGLHRLTPAQAAAN